MGGWLAKTETGIDLEDGPLVRNNAVTVISGAR